MVIFRANDSAFCGSIPTVKLRTAYIQNGACLSLRVIICRNNREVYLFSSVLAIISGEKVYHL